MIILLFLGIVLIVIAFFVWRKYRRGSDVWKKFIKLADHIPRLNAPPVDIVYLWVDGSDERWRRKRDKYATSNYIMPTEPSRSRDNGELLYSMRSCYNFARDILGKHWFRKIFIVTDGQRPKWLANTPQVEIIDHSVIFPIQSHLPVFNSNAIECWLNRIPGLSEHFVYFNDDVMFGSRMGFEDLFDMNNEPIKFIQQYSVSEDNDKSPFIVSVKRARDCIRKRFNIEPPSSAHFMRALTKSDFTECQKLFANNFIDTSKSKFRNFTDTWIVHLLDIYSIAKKRCSVELIDGGFVSITDNIPFNLLQIKNALGKKAMCINDDSQTGYGVKSVMDVLSAYFPNKAPWEM